MTHARKMTRGLAALLAATLVGGLAAACGRAGPPTRQRPPSARAAQTEAVEALDAQESEESRASAPPAAAGGGDAR